MTIGARLGRTCLSVDVVRHRGLHKYLFDFEPFCVAGIGCILGSSVWRFRYISGGASAAAAAPAEQAKVEKELSGWAAWRATVGGPRRSAAAEEARNAEKHRKLEEQLWQ